jgi:hypothetical protein
VLLCIAPLRDSFFGGPIVYLDLLAAQSRHSAGRAQRFLKDALASGPKCASDVEEAAERAHVDLTALAQARADLGIVTTRANAGGVMAVQWSLPG